MQFKYYYDLLFSFNWITTKIVWLIENSFVSKQEKRFAFILPVIVNLYQSSISQTSLTVQIAVT